MPVTVTIERVGTVTDDVTGKQGNGLVAVVNGRRHALAWKTFQNTVAAIFRFTADGGDPADAPKSRPTTS